MTTTNTPLPTALEASKVVLSALRRGLENRSGDLNSSLPLRGVFERQKAHPRPSSVGICVRRVWYDEHHPESAVETGDPIKKFSGDLWGAVALETLAASLPRGWGLAGYRHSCFGERSMTLDGVRGSCDDFLTYDGQILFTLDCKEKGEWIYKKGWAAGRPVPDSMWGELEQAAWYTRAAQEEIGGILGHVWILRLVDRLRNGSYDVGSMEYEELEPYYRRAAEHFKAAKAADKPGKHGGYPLAPCANKGGYAYCPYFQRCKNEE